jgi:hypothetical protein
VSAVIRSNGLLMKASIYGKQILWWERRTGKIIYPSSNQTIKVGTMLDFTRAVQSFQEELLSDRLL